MFPKPGNLFQYLTVQKLFRFGKPVFFHKLTGFFIRKGSTPLGNNPANLLFDLQKYRNIRSLHGLIAPKPELFFIIRFLQRGADQPVIVRIIINIVDFIKRAVRTERVMLHVLFQKRQKRLILICPELIFLFQTLERLNTHKRFLLVMKGVYGRNLKFL